MVLPACLCGLEPAVWYTWFPIYNSLLFVCGDNWSHSNWITMPTSVLIARFGLGRERQKESGECLVMGPTGLFGARKMSSNRSSATYWPCGLIFSLVSGSFNSIHLWADMRWICVWHIKVVMRMMLLLYHPETEAVQAGLLQSQGDYLWGGLGNISVRVGKWIRKGVFNVGYPCE